MTNCVDIKLHINPLKEGIDINSYGTSRHIRIPIDDINIDFLSFIKELKLNFLLAELFYTKPFSVTGIHVDVQGGDYTKLNYVYGGTNSKMHWYKLKETTNKSATKTPIDTYSILFNRFEVDPIESQSIKFPSLVQAGIPHNVINLSEPRYCLSVVLTKIDNSRITMKEGIEIFKPYINWSNGSDLN